MYWDRVSIKNLINDKNHIKNNTFNFNMKKSVTFNNRIKIILIPNKEEYIRYALNDLLWWNNEDYKKFQENFLLEADIFINIHENILKKNF